MEYEEIKERNIDFSSFQLSTISFSDDSPNQSHSKRWLLEALWNSLDSLSFSEPWISFTKVVARCRHTQKLPSSYVSRKLSGYSCPAKELAYHGSGIIHPEENFSVAMDVRCRIVNNAHLCQSRTRPTAWCAIGKNGELQYYNPLCRVSIVAQG